jgi:arylsulfatase A-like enzyme
LAGILLSACTPEAPPVTSSLSLLDLFPYTDVGQAVAKIDLGSTAAEPHLRGGWSAPETLTSGDTVAWGTARVASLQFSVLEPADSRLVVRAGLLGPRALSRAVLQVRLNGRPLGRLLVDRTLREHALSLPARVQLAGANVLAFTNSLLRSTRGRSDDRAGRAVAIDWVAFEGLNAQAWRPRLASLPGGTTNLLLPSSGGVDFFLRLPQSARLTLLAVVPPGAKAVQLRVSLQRQGEPERVLFEAVPPPRSLEIELKHRDERHARLRLGAIGRGALRVVAPRLRFPAPGAAAKSQPATRGTRRGTNVILYLVDTLRAGSLGCYGARRPTSPNIDRFAAGGIVYTRTVAQSPWTKPATASILTGRNPPGHGAVSLAASIAPGAVTLAQVLERHGYRTAAFVTNVNAQGVFGFHRGFGEHVYLPEDPERPTVHVPAHELHERVMRWLDGRKTGEPFFLYVHASDPHAPYRPPASVAVEPPIGHVSPAVAAAVNPLKLLLADPSERTAANVGYVRALYDGEVSAVDASVGALLDALEARGLADTTVVILTADHGEEFHEHGGFEHGRTLYDEQLLVPLILRLPGGAYGGRRVNEVARQIDVLPTVLTYLGLPVPSGVEGTPLPPIATPAPPMMRDAYSESSLGRVEIASLTTGRWKIIRRARLPRASVEVYDLGRDPAEIRNVAAEEPVLVGYAGQELARLAATAARPGRNDGVQNTLDTDTASKLKALGYLGKSE